MSHFKKLQLEKHRVSFLSLLSLDLQFCGLFDPRSQTSQGIDRRKNREQETVSVCSHLHSFRKHSIASYCDPHFVVLAGERGSTHSIGSCWLCLPWSFCICVRTLIQTLQKAQCFAVQLPFSASAIVTKSTLSKAILNIECFYLMVITIVFVVLVNIL